MPAFVWFPQRPSFIWLVMENLELESKVEHSKNIIFFQFERVVIHIFKESNKVGVI
jgi:hypothetical protein